MTCKIRRYIACFLMISIFMTWGRVAFALPLYSMIMGISHDVSLTYEHGEIHLSFDHNENHLDHNTTESDFYKHDLLSGNLAILFSNQNNHPDHEFHISSLIFQHSTATASISKVLKISSHTDAIDRSIPKYYHQPPVKQFSQSFLEINPAIFFLRNVVLLI